jgi:hypothetical protein
MGLSSRIENSCTISKKSTAINKSPLKLCFGNDGDTNFNNMRNLLDNNTKKLKVMKKPEISTFDDILKSTRIESIKVENESKIQKKNEKLAKLKLSKFDKENRYN